MIEEIDKTYEQIENKILNHEIYQKAKDYSKAKEKIKLLNTFIGTKLSKGKHEVVIKYTPKVLYLSFIPSILGLCILILYLKKKKTTI